MEDSDESYELRSSKELVKDFAKCNDYVLIKNNIINFNLIDKEKYFVKSCCFYQPKITKKNIIRENNTVSQEEEIVHKPKLILYSHDEKTAQDYKEGNNLIYCKFSNFETAIKRKIHNILTEDEINHYIININRSIDIFEKPENDTDTNKNIFNWNTLVPSHQYVFRIGCKIEFVFTNIMVNFFLLEIIP